MWVQLHVKKQAGGGWPCHDLSWQDLFYFESRPKLGHHHSKQRLKWPAFTSDYTAECTAVLKMSTTFRYFCRSAFWASEFSRSWINSPGVWRQHFWVIATLTWTEQNCSNITLVFTSLCSARTVLTGVILLLNLSWMWFCARLTPSSVCVNISGNRGSNNCNAVETKSENMSNYPVNLKKKSSQLLFFLRSVNIHYISQTLFVAVLGDSPL